MPFQKGHKRSPGAGMKPGQKSLKVMAWERLGEYIINEGADRYLETLRNLPDKEFNYEYRAVMEFFKPKLQRAEVKQETTLTDTSPRRIYIGFTEEEELRLRRADEQETEIPGSIPKIQFKRDNDQETEIQGCNIRYRKPDETVIREG